MPIVSVTPTNPLPVDEETRKYKDIIKRFTSTSCDVESRDITRQFLALDHSKIHECDFDARNRNGKTFMMIVVIHPEFKVHDLRTLIRAGANPNIQDEKGNTALMLISDFSSSDYSQGVTELLLEAGADPNLQDEEGLTALMICMGTHSSNRLIEILLRAGANPNIQDNEGKTALMYALVIIAEYGIYAFAEEIVKMLLDAGADPDIQDERGLTVLMLCVDECIGRIHLQERIVSRLLKAGADPNLQNREGQTALMLVTLNDYDASPTKLLTVKRIIQMLLDAGADRYISTGKTAYDYANHSEIKKILDIRG